MCIVVILLLCCCVLLCIAVYCCVLLCVVLYCCVLLFIFVILLCIVVYICYIVVYCCVLHSCPLLLVTLLTGLAQFGSGRYWVVSECCLDILEGVWKEYQMCLESACKVSGSCKKDFLSQKLTNVKKKKGLFGPKNQAGAELKQKKRIF